MPPLKPLPYSDEFASAHEYIESLLELSATSTTLQTLCGGVHILDFFTRSPSLYHTVIPAEWRSWLMARDPMTLLDFLMRDDLSVAREDDVPESLMQYVKSIRKHSLRRNIPDVEGGGKREERNLPRHVAVGMIPKKAHEVSNFADFVVRVAHASEQSTGKPITHFVDFGSGRNYLGRTLASPPYNKNIVAVESRELNISGAKSMDVVAGVAEREKVMRNKKLYRRRQEEAVPEATLNEKALRRRKQLEAKEKRVKENGVEIRTVETEGAEKPDFRPIKDLKAIYTPKDGKGCIQYVEHQVQDGDLSNVFSQIEKLQIAARPISDQKTSKNSNCSADVLGVVQTSKEEKTIRLMAISIHSCGNLSHHGIKSLLLNTSVHAIAIVGCCYNLLTERLSPPTYKLPHLRPNLKAINAPSSAVSPCVSNGCDPHGFPMSERIATYGEDKEGLTLNITARMMAVQAPANWTEEESDSFFTRHFYRALLQKIFLDYGVVSINPTNSPDELESSEPVIIGSLRKSCYASFTTYVRGALEKLATSPAKKLDLSEKMGGVTDEVLERYEREYGDRKKELSVTWSLMAFSAGVVESLIVSDRWLYLKEQKHEVGDAWVEAVFEYGLSPRNLVVVGIKK